MRAGGRGRARQDPRAHRHALARAAFTDRWVLALVLGYLASGAWLIVGPEGGWQPTFFWAVQAPGDFMFFASAWLVTRHPGTDPLSRRFWRLATFAAGAFVTGDVLRTLEGLVGLEHYEAGPLQTVLFVIGQTAMVVALAGYPALSGSGPARKRFLLDATIVACGSGGVIWFLLTGPSAQSVTDGSVIGGLFVGAEVMLVGFLAVKLALTGQSPACRATAGMMITAAMVSVVFTTVVPIFTEPRYGTALSIQLPSTLLIALGPRLQILQLRIHGRIRLERVQRPYSSLPYVAVTVVYVLLIVALALSGMLDVRAWGMVGTVGLVTALVVWRQLLSMTENAQLIAQRDRSLLDLNHERDRFQALVAHSSDITMVVDEYSMVTYASPSAERILGVGPGELVGSSLTAYMHPDDLERVRPEWRAMLAIPGHATTTQGRMKTADRGWRWLEVVNTNLLHVPAIAGVVCNGRDVTDARELEKELIHQASHDVLTQLANRRLFAEQLTAAGREGSGEVALLMIDLDGFKPINDTYGHHVGDAVLVAVAERIRRCIRPTDTAARLGGDEFAVLLPGSDLEQAHRLAERFQAALAEPIAIGSLRLAIGASVGMTVGNGGTDPDALLRRADAEMYAIKRRSRPRRHPVGVGPENPGA